MRPAKLNKSEGSSPLLAVVCPTCKANIGRYCTKPNGERQVIAHKTRTASYLAGRKELLLDAWFFRVVR